MTSLDQLNGADRDSIINSLLGLVKYGFRLSQKKDRDTVEEQIVSIWGLLKRHDIHIEQY